MQAYPLPIASTENRPRTRTALVASADRSFRNRLSETLTGLRWKVTEAEGGAEAWAAAVTATPEAVIVDSWLPDLELAEFLRDFSESFPNVDLLTTGVRPKSEQGSLTKSPYRQELLYALRRSQDTDSAVWNTAPALSRPFSELNDETASMLERAEMDKPSSAASDGFESIASQQSATNGDKPILARESLLVFAEADGALTRTVRDQAISEPTSLTHTALPSSARVLAREVRVNEREVPLSERLPELVGTSQNMLEVSRRIRLVAPRITPVLIEGPTGSGKEIVAEGLHRLSSRNRKPFVAINCAAIPEALLEAELFGHTRGAFTGAVQGRVGRIEAADGGTLFLDEIGEMPLALQSKLLRFVESGELQRVGDNETVKVDVRIVAATHQPLGEDAQLGKFRADLYYRLAVFLIRTPALRDHREDLPMLVAHFLEKMGRDTPVKRLDESALEHLLAHDWPGNVRELEHVLERAAILAGDETTITAHEIDFGLPVL
jgi:DNA-binding NtrC family response regulator